MSKATCSVDDCEKPTNSRGLCVSHYHRARRRGELPDFASRHTRRLTDVDVEGRTCTCPIHGEGSRLRVRVREKGTTYFACRECERGANKGGKGNWAAGLTREERRRYWLRTKYGVTVEEVEIRLQAQQYQCLICATDIADEYSVDHCHERGHVRGLLCRRCNVGLGWFNDIPERLERAARYLRQNRVSAA